MVYYVYVRKDDRGGGRRTWVESAWSPQAGAKADTGDGTREKGSRSNARSLGQLRHLFSLLCLVSSLVVVVVVAVVVVVGVVVSIIILKDTCTVVVRGPDDVVHELDPVRRP